MASYIDPSFRASLIRRPSERSNQDLTLINAHLKSLEALSSFRDTTIRTLCKTVRYEKHEANDVLYRFGRRSAGQTHRIHDCLVLETSEMLVIDYPKQANATTTTTTIHNPHYHHIVIAAADNNINSNKEINNLNSSASNTAVNQISSSSSSSSSSVLIPKNAATTTNTTTTTTAIQINANNNTNNKTTELASIENQQQSQLLNQRIMIKSAPQNETISPKLTTFANLASLNYQETTTVHTTTTLCQRGNDEPKNIININNNKPSTAKLIKTSFSLKDKLISQYQQQPVSNNHLNVNLSSLSHSTGSVATTSIEDDPFLNDDLIMIDNKIMDMDDVDDDDDEEEEENEPDEEMMRANEERILDNTENDDDVDDDDEDLHNLNILCNDTEVIMSSDRVEEASPSHDQHIKSICIITGNSAYRPKKGTQAQQPLILKHHPFKSNHHRHHHHHHHHHHNHRSHHEQEIPVHIIESSNNNNNANNNLLNLSQQTLESTTNPNNSLIEAIDDTGEIFGIFNNNTSNNNNVKNLVTTQLLNTNTRPNHKHTNSGSSSICSSKSSSILSNNILNTTNAINSNTINSSKIQQQHSTGDTGSVGSAVSKPDEDRLSAVSAPTSKDMVREVLEKDPKDRTDEDIDVLFEFMQTLPAFSNLTEPLTRKLCACMVLGVVDKADTLVLDNNERLDSWAVVLNGHVECVMPDSSVKTYHIGDHFGVSPVLEAVYHQGVMRTKCDDCQFVLVKQADYHDILNKGKENTRSYYDSNNHLCMLSEFRPINNSLEHTGEIVLRATPEKLVERLVYDDSMTLLDPTYIQDFLLTYRVFIDTPVYISSRLFEWFMAPENSINNSNNNGTSSPILTRHQNQLITNGVMIKKKVYRIVLEWITNHFNDFEANRELYDFVEKFQEQLSKEKMYEQFRVLSIAISTKSKQRLVTLARSKRDEALMFNIQGGWEKGYGVFISKVDRDSKAYELGLRRGDQILDVNGHSFMHTTLNHAMETLKSFTHCSITLKYNPIGFNEMLLHPEKSPHRNKKNFTNNNKAYLIEYLKQQQNNYQQQQPPLSQHHNTPPGIGSVMNDSPQSPLGNGLAKKSIGSIPPLPPSASANSLTPRNKSKDKPPTSSSSHFKLLTNNSNGTSNTKISKIFGRFNRKAHSKDLEHLSHMDSSAPSLKSITRSPSPSLSAAANFHQPQSQSSSFSGSITAFGTNSKMMTSDYSSVSLSRNNSATNLNDIEHLNPQQQTFDTSLAKMSLQDQQQFVGEHVLKIYKNDQNFKYLVVHKETSTKEVVMLTLNEFNIHDEIGSNAYSLCEVSIDTDRVIKQKRLPDQLNNLAERLPLNARYYLKCNTAPEQFLSDTQAADELIKDSTSTFLQLEPLEIAAQLTLRDYCIFKSIESSEYIDSLFKKSGQSKHLAQFADLSNEEMFWVINEILHESSLIKRARIIKHFIHIAHVCRECKNFNSLFAILSGLDHLSVTRLKDTWDKVSNKYKKILQELKTILDPSFNMMKYRNLFKNELIQPPIIPFFPICQKDLYFTKESSETLVDGLINFEKLRKLSKSVRSIVQMTSSSFDLTSMRDVPTSHSIIFSMFGCTNPSLTTEYTHNRLASSTQGGGGLSSSVSAKLNININIKADHIKKLYEEAVMVRKVRHYLAQMSRMIEKNEERLRLISSTLEHSTSGNTLKRNHPQPHQHHKPSPNSSLGGSVNSINSAALNMSGGGAVAGISSGNGTLMTHKNALFGAHSPDAVKKLLALSETKVKTVKNSSSSSSVPLSQLSSSRLLLNTSTSSSSVALNPSLSLLSNNSAVASSPPPPTTPLSPKTKHRSASSSQPLNHINHANNAINNSQNSNNKYTLSSESSSVSTLKLNQSSNKYNIMDNGPMSVTVKGNEGSGASKKKTAVSNGNMTKSNTSNLIASGAVAVEADSGRASMASNVDQDQCSPTFQQRAFILNRYLASDQQYKATNKVPINNISRQLQLPINPPQQLKHQGPEMFSNTSLKSQIKISNETLENQNSLEEEEDQVSAV